MASIVRLISDWSATRRRYIDETVTLTKGGAQERDLALIRCITTGALSST